MRGGPELLTKPTSVINRKMHFNKQLMLRISRSAAALCLCLLVGMKAKGQSENQAVTGAPFGIGKVSVKANRADLKTLEQEGFRLSDSEGRVFFPAMDSGVLRRLWNQNPPSTTETKINVWFLFKGAEPIELRLDLASRYFVQIDPGPPRRPAIAQRLWRSWWREYNAAARLQLQNASYPPVIETYLTGMLGQRLALQPPLADRVASQDPGELQEAIELLFGTERLRYDLLRQSFAMPSVSNRQATYPLPPPIQWPQSNESAPSESSDDLEPLAKSVPRECFYVRLGSWANQVWLKNFAENEGADLARLINLRSFDKGLFTRLQTQLGIQNSKLTDLFGGRLIDDVALIGLDAFVREGASMGVVLQAKNGLLGPGILQQRQATKKRWEASGAELNHILIDGTEVSLLSSPDRRLWSYHVEKNRIHLISNSLELVRRFLRAGGEAPSLASSPEFVNIRKEFPADQPSSVFAYFSREFFENLLTPHYQIELRRRLKSVTEIEALIMAQSVAEMESMPTEDFGELRNMGLLPASFGMRVDGSYPTLVDGEWRDSLRGPRGFLLPIPDVEVTDVTLEELQGYQKQAEFFREKWPELDPIVIALNRKPNPEKGIEELSFEVRAEPFGETKYAWLLNFLGPPMTELVRTDENNLMTIQASVRGGLPLETLPHRLFLTLSDAPPKNLNKAPEQWKPMDMVRNAPGYLGAWPKPGFLDVFPFGLGGTPDAAGFTRSLLGLWRWQGDGFSLISFEPELLSRASETIHVEVQNIPAHLHLQVGDLAGSKIRPWLEQIRFWRARQATLGNVRLINGVMNQLGVAPESAKTYTEDLLDVKLLCPLEGTYEVSKGDSGLWRHVMPEVAMDRPAPTLTGTPFQPLPLDVLENAEFWAYKGANQLRVWGKLGIQTKNEP